jgi:hypothetical protein
MTQKPRLFSAFRIKTTAEVITFFRSRTSAHSEAAVGDTGPRLVTVGCSFELGEPAVIQWADGRGFTGGPVLSVVQLADLEFEPMP